MLENFTSHSLKKQIILIASLKLHTSFLADLLFSDAQTIKLLVVRETGVQIEGVVIHNIRKYLHLRLY